MTVADDRTDKLIKRIIEQKFEKDLSSATRETIDSLNNLFALVGRAQNS
jgi:hypothetical protein